ncbi:MAG: hypothetical protein Q8K30_05110 [Candidatus Gracilibacteria bacterium]|nr:hypothetical protein [Candidatus Gracilibacteria bacterium]
MSYQIYELKLKPLSPWISDLTADTIFGHLCWQIKYEFGKEVLEKFLKEMAIKPIFTISDVLPADRLPRPISDFDGDIKFNKTYEDNFISLKKSKKFNKEINYIDENNLTKFKDINKEDLLKIREDENYLNNNNKNNTYYSEGIENKNIINRNTGITSEGGIYSQNYIYFNENSRNKALRVFLKVFNENSLEEYNIMENIKNIFSIGYGKKKSQGKGYFKVGDWNEYTKIQQNTGNKFLLLSNFIPSNKDSTNGNYNTFTKFPKMGEEFSSEGQNFYKKPMIMIKSGATFEKGNNYEGYVGKMIDNSAIKREKIYHYAYGFTFEF